MSNGLLGKVMSQANTDVQVYAAGASIQFATVNINLVNMANAEATARIAITTSGSPSAADYLDFGSKIPANGGILERTCVVMSPNEKIFVHVDNSNTAVRVHGLEQT